MKACEHLSTLRIGKSCVVYMHKKKEEEKATSWGGSDKDRAQDDGAQAHFAHTGAYGLPGHYHKPAMMFT